MKIAIPVDDQQIETNVSMSFGRAPYFLIYDVDTKESLFIDNVAKTSTGGAGIKAAQMVVDNQANILITPRLGQNAGDVLLAADIQVFKSIDVSVWENIDEYLAGNLSELEEIHAGFHGHGGHGGY